MKEKHITVLASGEALSKMIGSGSEIAAITVHMPGLYLWPDRVLIQGVSKHTGKVLRDGVSITAEMMDRLTTEWLRLRLDAFLEGE